MHKNSRLRRCELIITDRCNFKCPYCRGVKPEYKGDLPLYKALSIIRKWSLNKLESIRFSGGEPTLYPYLKDLVFYSKLYGIENIAISTNGTASYEFYIELIKLGVNDFSISLDSCCSSVADKMSGVKGKFNIITDNIRKLAKETYVTVGIVLNETNCEDTGKIIDFASGLGVSDIRIIPSAQYNKPPVLSKNMSSIRKKHPILDYRLNNLEKGVPFRGLTEEDAKKCHIVLDDMLVLKDQHFPCVIYMREQGKPIGSVNQDIEHIRQVRYEWFLNHNIHEDKICRENCLDVCRKHNNVCNM